MSTNRNLEREFQQHSQRINSLAYLTRQVAGQTNATVMHVTRGAIRELEAINAELKKSSLPKDQRDRLFDQVDNAIFQHKRLLEEATRHAQKVLGDAGNQPLPKRTAMDELVDGIDDTLHALTGGMFRRR